MTQIDLPDDLLAATYDQADADTIPEAVEHALHLWLLLDEPYELLVEAGQIPPDEAPVGPDVRPLEEECHGE